MIAPMFLQLDPARILATTERLRDRIRERFPTANLAKVADELVAVAKAHAARSALIQRASRWPAIVGTLVLLFAITFVGVALASVHPEVGDRWQLTDVIQARIRNLQAAAPAGKAR